MKRALGFLTFWRVVLGLVLGLGAHAIYVRLFHGLGASTNLSDQFPWGLWIGFDVLCGVGLAAGGFTLCAVVHIFNIKRFEPIVRPAILTAFLGYLLVAVAITIDIGRPWRIWHPLVFWNPNSVMFEVAWCVTLYLTVLALEFSPIVFERLRAPRALKIIHAISTPIVIAGVILSTLHQSSLGSLYLIVPGKLHTLWYSPLLPVLFYLSATAIGFAMVIVESNFSRRAFGRELEMPLLSKLGQAIVVLMGTYGLLRIYDMQTSGALAAVSELGEEALLFLAEMAVMVVIPVVMLSIRRVRENPRGLFIGAFTALLGFVLNRLNVAITGMKASSGVDYQPAWTEWTLTAGFVAGGILVFMLAVRYLPIFPEAHPAPLCEETGEAAAEERALGETQIA